MQLTFPVADRLPFTKTIIQSLFTAASSCCDSHNILERALTYNAININSKMQKRVP